ncbi:Lrp/AsnC family transcriptional regulator [Amycolatopsis pithecellobii]|uniref:AsnC family transcriptional regulator n=1 Tax=Amycolatopsis pithecellobii TaxID=664692 RepID=A0A6N7Z5S5_9PSEU|nr:Lrp/AsnC family transcriptional regulator [Amycolatopsis pithecellobii]MTD56054.1 AsnC family transcriptional regulator [Amycolatopsis pithecellobii]
MKSPGLRKAAQPAGPNSSRLDEIDRRILELLTADARRSSRALAREIGMSPGAVTERVNRLESTGVILGYHADVDAGALGFGMDVLVGTQLNRQQDVDETVRELLAVDEVQAVHVTSGTWDLVISLRVRDHLHLREIMLEVLHKMPNIQRNEAMIILQSEHRRKHLPGGAEPEELTSRRPSAD